MNVTEVPPSPDNCNDNSTQVTEYDVWQQVLISVLAIGLSLVTVIGNSMVMIAIRIDKQLQTISNNFLFSLAVADFAIGLISMPLFTVYTVFGYWPFGSIVCDTWLALDYLASNASVLNLLIISFDRYFSVTRPLTYRAKRTPKKAAIMIAGAWGISILLWPPWIYAWPYIEGERTVPKDECYIQFIETNHYITFGTAIAAFYFPVSLMMLLYWRIWRETEKRIKDLKELQEGKQDASKRSNSSDEALDMEGCRRGRSASSTGHDDVNSSNFASSYLERRYPDAKNRTMSWSSLKMWCIAWWHSGREDDDDEDDITATDVPSKTIYPGDETLTPVSAETPFNSTISRPSLTVIPSSENSQVRKNMSADPVYTIVIKLPPSSAPSITMYEDLISLQDHHKPLETRSVIGTDDRPQPRRIDSVSTMDDVRLPLTIRPVQKSVTCTNVKPPPKKKKRTQDKKAAKILSAILAAFVITWTPYNILVLLKPLTRACIIQIPNELWSFFYYLCYINSTINPLCYALCNANFRRTYWRILQCKWRRNAARAYCPP
ncbi:muscarinic acetylcholine receptor DM1 isoform X1 [Diachasmimorpha longicaudata]|uniref:muscarinic acetylcholine receptor DM1 isoform X1 n=1 Tax=Diachasmimorpha longicaudata TaxID=58733 RepID=UPI0030B8BDD2